MKKGAAAAPIAPAMGAAAKNIMTTGNVYYYEDIKAEAKKIHNEFEFEAAVRVFETINYYDSLLPDIETPGDEIALVVVMDQRIKNLMSEMSTDELKMLEIIRTAMNDADSEI